MSDSNNQNDVLAGHDHVRIARENAELRAKLAELQNNVSTGQFRGEAPRYLLNEPVYMDDTYLEKGSIIETFETPNLSMVPQNEPARRAIEEHIELLEHGARTKAAQQGRQFTGLVTDRGVLLAESLQDARAAAQAPVPVIQVPTPIGEVPAMPHTDAAQVVQRRRGRPPKVVVATPPAPQGRPKDDRGAPMLGPTEPAIVGRMVG